MAKPPKACQEMVQTYPRLVVFNPELMNGVDGTPPQLRKVVVHEMKPVTRRGGDLTPKEQQNRVRALRAFRQSTTAACTPIIQTHLSLIAASLPNVVSADARIAATRPELTIIPGGKEAQARWPNNTADLRTA